MTATFSPVDSGTLKCVVFLRILGAILSSSSLNIGISTLVKFLKLRWSSVASSVRSRSWCPCIGLRRSQVLTHTSRLRLSCLGYIPRRKSIMSTSRAARSRSLANKLCRSSMRRFRSRWAIFGVGVHYHRACHWMKQVIKSRFIYNTGLQPAANVAQPCESVTKTVEQPCPVFSGRTTTGPRRMYACVNGSGRAKTAPTPPHILVRPAHELVETCHHHLKTVSKTYQNRPLPYGNRPISLSQTFHINSCWNGSSFWPGPRRFDTFLQGPVVPRFFTWTAWV